MAGFFKRIVAILVSIVWLSLVLALLAGLVAPNLHQLLPAPVRELTDPQVLLEQWRSITDALEPGIGFRPTAEPQATETPTPEPALPPQPTATPVPETPTAEPPTAEPATPTSAPAVADDEEAPAPETIVSLSVSEAGQADLRSAPSEDADVIGLVAAGGKVKVTGRDTTGNWYRLEDGTWIDADDLVEAPLDQVPIVIVETQKPSEGPQEPSSPVDAETDTPSTQLVPVSAVVNADSNLRAGPGIEYDRVDGINFGEEALIMGISADGEWYLLENDVWLFAALVTEAVDVPVVTEDGLSDQMAATGTEQQEATEQTQEDAEQTGTEQPDTDEEQTTTETEQTEEDAEPPQPVVIAPLGANLRAGPGVDFERVDGAEEGRVLTIVAQDETGEWLQLEEGSWIAAALVANVPADLPVGSAETTEDDQDAQTDEDDQDAQTDEDDQDAQTDEDDQDAQTDEDDQDAQTDEDDQDEQSDDDQDEQSDDDQDTLEEITPVLFATVNTDANLRDGPGLDATIVDFAPAGTQLTIVDRSDDEEWLQLDNGFWILAALVDILSAEEQQDADDDAGTEFSNENNDEGRVAQPQVWITSPLIS